MKKSVFVLLVLLAILIVTCVYQKTYTIYSNSPKELTLIERKPTIQSKSTAKSVAVEKKEEKTSTLPIVAVPTPTKPVEVKPAPEAIPVQAGKPVAETKKAVQTKPAKPAIEKEMKEKAAPSITMSDPALKEPVLLTKEASVSAPVVAQKSKIESTDKPEPATGEKEIVDYVMWALNNREIALKNRDEVEARIQELITKVLDDRNVALAERKIVLDERDTNQVELEKHQAEQIDARDASYESVTNPQTTTQGEK